MGEMIGEVERPRLEVEEPVDMEGAEDELPDCRNASKITYTRALLLEFTDSEVCRKLPGDFDMLILSELNGVAGGIFECKRISGNSSLLGAMLYTGHNERGNKVSRWQGNRNSEESDVWQHLHQESRHNAVFFDQETADCGSFQLRKSTLPYRPPHCSKKVPRPVNFFSQLGVESSARSSFSPVGSDQQTSTDRVTGNYESGIVSPLDSQGVSIIQLHQCESSSSWNKEISEVCDVCDKMELPIIDDSQSTFEEFWADILESLQLQQEAELRPAPGRDSGDVACLPDKDRLISIDQPRIIHNTFNFNTSENDCDASSSDAEIIWPDEDSLISVEDMLGPIIPPNEDSVENVTSNVEDEIRNNSGCPYAKSHFLPLFEMGNNHVNFHSKSNCMPYIPTLNCFTCSNVVHQSCIDNARPNIPFVQYTMFQQPNICPRQQHRLPVDDLCFNPQRTTYWSFGKPKAASFMGKEASSFWHAQH